MDDEPQAILAAIMETAVDAIIVIDLNGIVQMANPATEVMFGFAVSALIGQNINQVMPQPYREQHDRYLKNYVDTGVAKVIGIGREVIGRRKDGSEFPIHLSVSEIQVSDRRLFAGIVRDITELKKAELQLKKLNEVLEQRVLDRTKELRAAQADLIRSEKLATLGQVSGGIAHEIRNPLNAIKTSAYYLLNAKQTSPEKKEEHLKRIDRQVTEIDNVITALADLARLPEPILGQCDIRVVTREVIRSISMPPTITVDDQLPAVLPSANVDLKHLSIVVRNLVRNARDSMPTGGTITVSAQADENHVVVTISDTGDGISPENLSRITEPLFSTKQGGMGLGLAITKAILDRNQGRLEVVSSVGSGSTFSILIPVAGSVAP